jgi:hypothetical protein
MDTNTGEQKMEFIPTFGVYSSETDPLPLRTGFATLRDAIVYADSKRKRYVIRRSRYIPGCGADGNYPRGMIVHTVR